MAAASSFFFFKRKDIKLFLGLISLSTQCVFTVQGEELLSANNLPVIPTHTKQLQITMLYTYF